MGRSWVITLWRWSMRAPLRLLELEVLLQLSIPMKSFVKREMLTYPSIETRQIAACIMCAKEVSNTISLVRQASYSTRMKMFAIGRRMWKSVRQLNNHQQLIKDGLELRNNGLLNLFC